MRKIFKPEEVVKWTPEDFAKLVGKYVNVEVEASEWYKETHPDGGAWEGGSGFCEEAGIKPGVDDMASIRYVVWDYGMSWGWLPFKPLSKESKGMRFTKVYVSVCDEHGEHRTKGDVDVDSGSIECLKTLGIRGAMLEAIDDFIENPDEGSSRQRPER